MSPKQVCIAAFFDLADDKDLSDAIIIGSLCLSPPLPIFQLAFSELVRQSEVEVHDNSVWAFRVLARFTASAMTVGTFNSKHD